MTDTLTVSDRLDEQARFIYEPVLSGLDLVMDNLGGLAESSGVPRDMVSHVVEGGGKLVRPTITLLAGALRPGEEEPIVKMATAVELLHIASLIHDDTVDHSEKRRGRATVSRLWGDDMAVLLGDYVFAASATFVCDTGNIRVVRRFAETIMELARGELTERLSKHDWSQSSTDYERRIYDKTASLICTAAESGGVLSGAPEEESQALRSFGYNVGMAFQIVDDVLDFTSSEEELGKPVGNDLLQGTLTLPALLFAASHPGEAVVRRLRDGSRDENDLATMVEFVRNSSAIEETLAQLEGYRNAARAAVALLPDARARQSLDALVDYLAQRRN
ncbi:MAG: polyprenyl synthetase family protein [Chloroflexota bacterium]|nr:polyprenyl synthetase family protein [Chloroflexota bacterium]MDE2885496.1 polyprenyl synthetase family protein [Chloroflexota bacterium]